MGFSRSEFGESLVPNMAAGEDEARCKKKERAITAEITRVRSILKTTETERQRDIHESLLQWGRLLKGMKLLQVIVRSKILKFHT